MLHILVILIFLVAALMVGILLGRKLHSRRHLERLEAIAALAPEVEVALADVSSFYHYSHYITESERVALDEKYAGLLEKVSAMLRYKELADLPQEESFRRLHKALSDTKANKQANNEKFVEKQLTAGARYFDTVLAYPLDQQQREAVVSLEDNVLVISSAGSGKTMTTVGKVRYLIDVQQVAPEKILLITFTRKAAESLSERLGEPKLKCRTFHKLALDLIGEATGQKPSITDQDFSLQVYHQLFELDASFHRAVSDYIIRSRYKMIDCFSYDSMQDYMQDRKKHGIQAFFKDMDGHPVFCKSDQESQICDFLGSRGIKFRYEEKYEVDTFDADHRQYHPDFSIYIERPNKQTRRIYLEHFAVDGQLRCPPFFSEEEALKYKQGIDWKRQLHKEHGTVLLETTSGGFQRGDVFEVLSRQLLDLGAVFSHVSNPELSRELARQEENILNMLTAFNFLSKSRNADLRAIRRQVSDAPDRQLLDDIVIPFVKAYRQIAEQRGEVDFTDAIIRATDLCNNGHRPDYDYILVDEFQDISVDRYHFLQALRRDRPLTKLFCVGDDWQSIYRFAGSDMALFKSFEQYFGYTKKCFMETTYRFGEPAIAQSSRFILANPEQEVKHVHPFRSDSETQLDFIPTFDRLGVAAAVKHIADLVSADKEILLLGRYSYDVNIFKDSDLSINNTRDRVFVTYGNRKMVFMTVHQSKGLESDYVILLNCNGGMMGFPADIADSPILRYVLSEPDAYDFSEERRVFYVAITRARKHTWVLYDANNPSTFVQEFVKVNRPKEILQENIPPAELCPKCRCGRVVVIKKGRAVNGNPYSVQVCSNEKYGCDFIETTFVNLNHYRRRSSNKSRY